MIVELDCIVTESSHMNDIIDTTSTTTTTKVEEGHHWLKVITMVM
jgi:hypothetical protein